MQTNKVVLITGAGRRIGAGIAQHCHQLGWRVILHANHSLTDAHALCASMNTQRSDSAVVLQADLRDASAISGLAEQASTQWNQLDCLINNASVFFPTAFEEETIDKVQDDWQTMMDINLKAPYLLAKQLYPTLKATGGCIINLLDVYAKQPLKGYPIYSISKAGLHMMTLALADACAPDVRVNGIAPGNILWPEGDDNALNPLVKEKILNKNKLKRQGCVNDIAKAAAFLMCDANFTTGHVISVDGGR